MEDITIDIDDHWVRCENLNQIKEELSKFLSDTSASQLFLYNNGKAGELFRQFKSLFCFIQAAGGLVKDDLGRLLFIQRLGMWDLPKGKTERGEESPQAALREVQEETGLHQLSILRSLPSTYHVYQRKGTSYLKHTRWFEMQSATYGPLLPQTEEDITEARWFSAQELSVPLSHTYPAIEGLVNEYITSSLLFL